MFGVLKGTSCAMNRTEKEQWMGHICGVCLSLRDNYGHAARITTNYDAALLSVLCEAQSETSSYTTSYCPLRLPIKLDVVPSSSAAAEYAASITLTMGATKIEDHLDDGETALRWMPRVSQRVASRWREASREKAQSLAFDTDYLLAQSRRQVTVEAMPQQPFLVYAEPTELAVASAFAHTAVITERPQNSDCLHEMGRFFGRIMYLLDSYEDYADDLKKQKFNALAASFAPDEIDLQAKQLFRESHQALRKLFFQLELPRPTLARKLLLTQLAERGASVLNLSHCSSCSCTTSRLSTGILSGLGYEEKPRKSQRSICESCCDKCSQCCGYCCLGCGFCCWLCLPKDSQVRCCEACGDLCIFLCRLGFCFFFRW